MNRSNLVVLALLGVAIFGNTALSANTALAVTPFSMGLDLSENMEGDTDTYTPTSTRSTRVRPEPARASTITCESTP